MRTDVIKGENCDGTDFKMGVAATLSELSEWILRIVKPDLTEAIRLLEKLSSC